MSKRNRRHGGIEHKALRHLHPAHTIHSSRYRLSDIDFAKIEERMLADYGIAVAREPDGTILWDIETMGVPGGEVIMPTGKPSRALKTVTFPTFRVDKDDMPPRPFYDLNEMLDESREWLQDAYMLKGKL